MRHDFREAPANWLILAGALILLGSLFLTWSHQLTPGIVARFGSTADLQGLPPDPTAWQVYSAADVVLAALALSLAAVAIAPLVGAPLFRGRGARVGVAIAAAIGLAFVIHALAVPPTNGVLLADARGYVSDRAGAGPGETLAIVALILALAGLLADAVTLTGPGKR